MALRITGGALRGRLFYAPKGEQTRPTSERARAALCQILEPSIEEARTLDLFAGSGAVGMEWLSRGAAHVCFVESHRLAIEAIRRSLESFGSPWKEHALLLPRPFERSIGWIGDRGPFDLIFADPPYAALLSGQPAGQKVLQLCSSQGWLRPGGKIIVEVGPRTQLEAPEGCTLWQRRAYGDCVFWIFTAEPQAASLLEC